jgi:hypothetical protein
MVDMAASGFSIPPQTVRTIGEAAAKKSVASLMWAARCAGSPMMALA